VDAVLGHSVLEALDRPGDALDEMRRVLRPGGIVAVASVEYGGLVLAGPDAPLLRRFYDRYQRRLGRSDADRQSDHIGSFQWASEKFGLLAANPTRPCSAA